MKAVKLIKIEMRKALQGKPFLISLVIGVTIAVLGAVFAILQEYDIWHAWEKIINADGTMNSNPLLAVSSLFRVWLGGSHQCRHRHLLKLLRGRVSGPRHPG